MCYGWCDIARATRFPAPAAPVSRRCPRCAHKRQERRRGARDASLPTARSFLHERDDESPEKLAAGKRAPAFGSAAALVQARPAARAFHERIRTGERDRVPRARGGSRASRTCAADENRPQERRRNAFSAHRAPRRRCNARRRAARHLTPAATVRSHRRHGKKDQVARSATSCGAQARAPRTRFASFCAEAIFRLAIATTSSRVSEAVRVRCLRGPADEAEGDFSRAHLLRIVRGARVVACGDNSR